MKRCSHCDREVMNDAKFCQFCGLKMLGEQSIVQPSFDNNSQNEAPPLPDVNNSSGDYSYNSTPPPNKGLVWLIVSSILTFFGCCCWGIGLLQVITIVTSAISVSRYNRGDYEGSESLAKTSMILFFSLLALSIILFVMVTVFSFNNAEFADIVDDFL